MRHLHFTQSLEPLRGGGLGSSTVALHRQMRANGVQSVLCSTHGGVPQYPEEGSLEFQRIKPDFVYFAPTMLSNASQLVSGTDVLHGHGLYVGTNFVFGREARRQRKPLVYHVHGMFEPYILQRSRWKKNLVHWLFENENCRHVRFWRALTNKEADQIRSCGIRQPIVVTPNGLKLNEFKGPFEAPKTIDTPLARNLQKTSPRVLFLGRVHPKKGLDLLLRTWAKIRGVTKDWQLVIAGPDELGHMAEVKKLVESLELTEQVVFTGAVTGQTKLHLLHSADLFVLPSRSEGFPMSVLEALASGVPVIATRACNFPDISSASAGWECDTDEDSLSSVLKRAFSVSDSELKERGRNGRRLVETKYDWSSIIQTLSDACAKYC